VKRLLLASRSPQRRAILERLGVAFEALPTGVVEVERGEPSEVALENALRKARAARDAQAGRPAQAGRAPQGGVGRAAGMPAGRGNLAAAPLVLGVDTVVALAGRIYGKPPDERGARETLQALSGQTHTVLSGLALLDGERELTAVARTDVSFRELSEGTIGWYLATGEWRERAGGYAIQGAGAALVRRIEGDYENVVGLPVASLLDLCPELL
jgi:septum formation protein